MKHVVEFGQCINCFVNMFTHKKECEYHGIDPDECSGCTCDHDCRFDRHKHDETCEHYDDCPMHPDFTLEQAFKTL